MNKPIDNPANLSHARKREELFRQLAEHLPECVWLTEVGSWKVLYVNPAFETIWGRSCESLYADGEQWIEGIHPLDRERVARAFVDGVASGDYAEEYRILRRDGSMRWISDRGFPIFDSHGKPYRIAGIAEDITERRELEQRVVEASNHERRRIGSELHDAIGQRLTALGYVTNRLMRSLETETPAKAALAGEVLDGIQTVLNEIKQIVRGLGPLELSGRDLSDVLASFVNSANQYSPIQCEFHASENVSIRDNNTAAQLFRIAQEAVNNALKHSNGSKIAVSLASEDGAIQLEIADNGHGFDRSALSVDKMGLNILQYRCRNIGAELNIQSTAEGTTVSCRLPQEGKT